MFAFAHEKHQNHAKQEQNNASRNNENGEHVHIRTGKQLKERQQMLRERYSPEHEKITSIESVVFFGCERRKTER